MQSIPIFFLIALPWLNPFAPGPSPAAVPLLFSWACAAGLLALCSRLSDRDFCGRLVTAAAWAWLAAGLLSSVMGLCQYFGAGASLLPWVNQTELGEAFANLRQRNQFATLTNMALAALLWLVATGRFGGRRAWLGWAAAALLMAGNAASSSRTGLLQLVLLCALAWLWGGWRQPALRRVLLAAVLAYALAAVLLPWLAGFGLFGHDAFARLRAGDRLCASRLTLWANVLQLIAQHPWLGWGWGQLAYAHYITLYDGPRFCEILDNAHNLPLQLAVTLGIPAALLVCGGFVWWACRQRPWREADPTRRMAWAILAVIGLHSLLEYPLWYGPFQIAFGLCLAWLWLTGARRNVTSNRPVVLGVSAQLAIVSVAFAVLTAVLYAAWDYHRVSQIYLAPEQRDAPYRDDTLAKVRDSMLFRNPVRFAELTITELTPGNAAQMRALAGRLLHYSPEPRVIEKLIAADVLLGRDDDALFHLARFRAAFPKDYAQWTADDTRLPQKLRAPAP
ncbi:Wzy polymerase domain-containing protein [Polaromonas sp. C04]|uniref:PglL family O-oligosaccharyltransferase n=1 Tax=Polaromonas sp. C04 TaxID=1945857 RepID=UPI000987CD88|nr:Wzy polymerase domain-containing protein [Polaromonas sp. C04]OOG54770.1 polymerase [Polaromonas sp. C04]